MVAIYFFINFLSNNIHLEYKKITKNNFNKIKLRNLPNNNNNNDNNNNKHDDGNNGMNNA